MRVGDRIQCWEFGMLRTQIRSRSGRRDDRSGRSSRRRHWLDAQAGGSTTESDGAAAGAGREKWSAGAVVDEWKW